MRNIAIILISLFFLFGGLYAVMDPYNRHSFIVGGIWFTICIISVGLSVFESKKKRIKILFFGVCTILISCLLWEFITPSDDRLLEEGREIVAKIESYYKINNKYPKALKDINEDNKCWRFGYWQYKVFDDESGYRLIIGDYGKDLFELSYSSAHGWDWDS